MNILIRNVDDAILAALDNWDLNEFRDEWDMLAEYAGSAA